jgi:hypothetical protein
VRRVLTTRGGFGERFVASWNERVELVEDDDAGARSCKYLTDVTDRALTYAPSHDHMTTNTNTKSNISYFDLRDGTKKSC